MPDDPERHLTLRQADQAPTDFAIIETEMETIHPSARPAAELGRPRRTALGIIFATTGLVIGWIELVSR